MEHLLHIIAEYKSYDLLAFLVTVFGTPLADAFLQNEPICRAAPEAQAFATGEDLRTC